jgi:hypothetical protein
MAKTESADKVRVTISVPEAGRRLGIGRNAAYEAARRGDLPTLRFGKRLVVPLPAFEAKLVAGI